MKSPKAVPLALRSLIIALVTTTTSPPANAQVRPGAVPGTPTDPASPSSKVVVLEVLPWDIPGLGSGFVAPEEPQVFDRGRPRPVRLSGSPIIDLSTHRRGRHRFPNLGDAKLFSLVFPDGCGNGVGWGLLTRTP